MENWHQLFIKQHTWGTKALDAEYLADVNIIRSIPGGSVVNNPPANAGDTRDLGSIPGSGRFPGVGHGNPLQYSCLENSIDRGAWQATVHRAEKSWTQLSGWAHTHILTQGYLWTSLYDPMDKPCLTLPACCLIVTTGGWPLHPWKLSRTPSKCATSNPYNITRHAWKTSKQI